MKSAQTNEIICQASSITPCSKVIYLNQTSGILTKSTPSGAGVVRTPGDAKLRKSVDDVDVRLVIITVFGYTYVIRDFK